MNRDQNMANFRQAHGSPESQNRISAIGGSSLEEKRDQGFLRIASLCKELIKREFIPSAVSCCLPFMANGQAHCGVVKDEPPRIFIAWRRSMKAAVKLAFYGCHKLCPVFRPSVSRKI